MDHVCRSVLALNVRCLGRAAGARSLTANPPSEELVNHIEGLLAEDPCVGNIQRWARLYEWGRTKEGIDTRVVEIDLRQAGVFGLTPGRVIRSRDPALGPGEMMVRGDDRDYRVAFGSYDVETGNLELRSCGQIG